MPRYKNTSVTAKTFYGTTFKPGDEHDVPGYINDTKMIRVSSQPKEIPKAASKKTSVLSSTKVAVEEVDNNSIKHQNKEDN